MSKFYLFYLNLSYFYYGNKQQHTEDINPGVVALLG